MVNVRTMFVALLAISAVAGAQDLHKDIQAVDADGNPTHPKVGAAIDPANQIVLGGIVLNNPEDILDSTAAYSEQMWDLGGQWQIYVQAVAADDFGGTACWIGQNYGNLPWIGFPSINNYSDAEWIVEMNRLNFDGGHEIRQGDLVRITGYGLAYGGKSNINERHSKSPANDFTIEYLGSSPGLPAPDVIQMSNVKDASGEFLFDQTRLTGCEHYQASLVRVNDVSFADDSGWATDGTVTIADGFGRTFSVKLGLDNAFDLPHNLDATFDIVGIFDQEDGNGGDGWTDGYRLWVTGYDGSTGLLGVTDTIFGDVTGDDAIDAADIDALFAAAGSAEAVDDLDGDDDADDADVDVLVADVLGTAYGDLNLDYLVNATDLAAMKAHFGGAGVWAEGEITGDGLIDATDLARMKSTFGFDASGSPVPEPATLVLAALSAGALLRRRR